ncbi:MAG: hypothetical protein H7196_01035 [candidate division SR1 bacterium]|nr:hypothetical protein [candidate division SR1 bacterium]
MLRFKNLKAFIAFGSSSAVTKKTDSSQSCDVYRKKQWDKYCASFYTLLASNTFYGNKKSSLLSSGFTYINGDEYIYPSFSDHTELVPHNLDNIVYTAVVTRPKIIWLPCMDERIQYLTASHHALSLGMPGCECLLDINAKEKIANEIVEICEKNKTIEEVVVSSHSGCGAVAKAIAIERSKQNWYQKIVDKFEKEDVLIDKNGEKYASSFAQILEQKMAEKSIYVNIRTHHFAQQELHSKHLHNALGAVVNLDPLLNTAEFEDSLELPMFNIYSGGQTAMQIYDNIVLAIAIASGNKGFGSQYITKQAPFIILFTTNLTKNIDTEDLIESVLKMLKSADLSLETIYKVLDTSN